MRAAKGKKRGIDSGLSVRSESFIILLGGSVI